MALMLKSIGVQVLRRERSRTNFRVARRLDGRKLRNPLEFQGLLRSSTGIAPLSYQIVAVHPLNGALRDYILLITILVAFLAATAQQLKPIQSPVVMGLGGISAAKRSFHNSEAAGSDS